MKYFSFEKNSFISAWRLAIAGIFVFFTIATAWVFLKEEPAIGDSPVLFSGLFSGHAEKLIASEPLSSDNYKRASLGIGLGWLTQIEQKVDALPYDTSLESFLASRKDICIPCYTDPVVWEENPRYTMQDNGCGTHIFRTKIKKGDNFGSLLRGWVEKEELNSAIEAVSSVFKVNRLRMGRIFSVEKNGKEGDISRLMYDIDEDSRLVVYRYEKGFKAEVNNYCFDTRIVRVSGEVKTSLFDAVSEAGEDAVLTMQLAEVFSHQIDFVNDVQTGDAFDIVVEKRYLEGCFRSYGDIVAARFINNGKEYEAFRFLDDSGVPHYYAADGSSLETQFLKAPLNFTRISSRYSMHRRHPVFGKVRPHQGVDYAAPRGTPVKALGEGKVTFVGWKRGYGKSVAIQHCGGVDTHYAHLSRYAKKLKRGDKVEQGQIIGYVGATGVATGPHLDFRVRKNGKFIDPLKLTGNRAEPIPLDKKSIFEEQMRRSRLMLNGEIILASM